MAALQDLADRVKPQTIYVDTDVGKDDDTATGEESKPYKSLAYAYIQHNGAEKQYQSRASETGPVSADGDPSERAIWKDPAKAAVKKAQGALDAHRKKLVKQEQAKGVEEAKEKARLQNLEEAKKIVIKEDKSLPKAKKITIGDKDVPLGDSETKGTRVKVSGRIHRLRQQKQATFITLVDGYGHLQAVIPAGDLTKTYESLLFTQGTSLTLYGELKKVLEGQQAPDNRELQVDYFEVLGRSPASGTDAISTRVPVESKPWELEMLKQRHLVIRGDGASSVLKVRGAIEWAFAKVYKEMKFTKVSPPAFVQTEVEGGSTLFKLDYYGKEAFLTQSSQLYLETALPSLGNVYCIEKSFRAENSITRRHLSEYTHIEGELDFIDFEDLLEHLEEIICRVVDNVLADEEIAGYIKELNPNFQKPSRPFKRMKYADAIEWLGAQDPPILFEPEKEDGKEQEPLRLHEFGDDIAEAAERRMTDIINSPILLTHFPAELKAFYMQKDKSDRRVTESVDVLMPGVGEIVGGSMRMDDFDELLAAYKSKNLNPADYEWYTDQRKYGTSPHGGYGLGLERFIAWICNQHSVRTCCLYPRYVEICKP